MNGVTDALFFTQASIRSELSERFLNILEYLRFPKGNVAIRKTKMHFSLAARAEPLAEAHNM